jgi:hypothetical protein
MATSFQWGGVKCSMLVGMRMCDTHSTQKWWRRIQKYFPRIEEMQARNEADSCISRLDNNIDLEEREDSVP